MEKQAKKQEKSKEILVQVAENQEDIQDKEYKNNKEKLKKYIRAGNDYYKELMIPDKTGTLYKTFQKWSRQTIIDDFGKAKLKDIEKYEGFAIVQSHTNYQKTIHGFFNEYHELSYKPKSGNCDTILGLIMHLFGISHYHFALDYLQLLYTQPTQRLPIILLESSKKGTGKSTFGDLARIMFEENVIKLGNADLQSDFNAFWVKKLAIVVDETSLEKKEIMQMIKRLSTETGKVTTNEKNKSQSQIDFIGKFIFMSNDEGKALPIEKGDTRFAVFKVPTFEENGIKIVADMEGILKTEIPAFVAFLLNREMFHHKKDRLYFEPWAFQTPQLQKYLDNAFSYSAKAIIELVKETFEILPDKEELTFSVSNIMHELEGRKRYFDRDKIKEALSEELKLEAQPKGRYTFWSLKNIETNGAYTSEINQQNNVHYVFNRKVFIS